MLLAGDIGGTKTNLAVFSSETGWRKPYAEATYSSVNYPDLESLVREFLAQHDLPIDRASFGVAGPVVAGHASITNLPWMMDEHQLQQALQIPSVRLLNDLDAIAHSVPHLESQDLHTLNEGQRVSGGAIAIIAPGTGLGEGFLTWDGSEEHTSELQSRLHLVCRLLLEKKKKSHTGRCEHRRDVPPRRLRASVSAHC